MPKFPHTTYLPFKVISVFCHHFSDACSLGNNHLLSLNGSCLLTWTEYKQKRQVTMSHTKTGLAQEPTPSIFTHSTSPSQDQVKPWSRSRPQGSWPRLSWEGGGVWFQETSPFLSDDMVPGYNTLFFLKLTDWYILPQSKNLERTSYNWKYSRNQPVKYFKEGNESLGWVSHTITYG